MRGRIVPAIALVLTLASCSVPGFPGQPTPAQPITSTAWPTITVRPVGTATTIPVSATPQPTPDLSWILEAPLSQAAVYENPPTLQYLSADTAWIHFATVDAVDLTLHLWPESDPLAYQQLELQGGQEGLILTDLIPGTTYLAQILAVEDSEPRAPRFLDGQWGSLRFETLPAEPQVLRFGVIGDSGFGDPVTAALVDQLGRHDLDFVIHTGDVVYRGEENASPAEAFAVKYYQPFRPLLRRVPVYPAVGNHEYDLPVRLNGLPYYYSAFPRFPAALDIPGGGSNGRDWYAVGFGGWDFLFLNTQTFFGVPGSEEQLQWLEQQLTSAESGSAILAMHVPPFSQGRHQGDSAWVAANLSRLFSGSPVRMTLGGHDHNYQRFLIGDVHHIVSGGGSATLYRIPGADPSMQASAAASHVVIIELRSGEAEILVVDPAGIALDRESVSMDSR